MSGNIDQKTGFELYLEGIKVPFSSINISEAEGQFPSASISFPATSGATEILPGTIVQIFGPASSSPDSDKAKVLLFEGEVQALSYQKGSQGRVASLQARSVLANFDKATIRPKGALVSQKRTIAEGLAIGGEKFVFMNNSNIQGAMTNGEYMKALEDAKESFSLDNVTTELLDNISETAFAPFVLSFTELLASDKVEGAKLIGQGELYYFIEFFLRFFEQSDPYYATISRSFRLPESIFTWPNSGRMYPFKSRMILNKSLKVLSSLSTSSTINKAKLMQAIQLFMEVTRYSMAAPAAPTHSQLFWLSDNQRGPNRMNFTPNLDNSPPALCNIFFPDQVTAFSHQRQMANEATRVIGQLEIPTVNQQWIEQGFTPISVAPRLQLDEEAVRQNRIAFTPEETYRGINAYNPRLEWYFAQPVLDQLKKQADGGNPTFNLSPDVFHFGKQITIEELQGFADSMQQMTISAYLRSRYEGRSATINAEWSPFRLIGLPGLVLENNGASVAGVVSSINTTIDANGSATSSISLRAPRLINDELFEFLQSEGSDDSLLKYAINAFTNDGYLDTNYFLYDPELYNFTNIGSDLYNYLTFGSGSSFGNKMNANGSAAGFSKFKSNIDSLDESPLKDASILNYIKDENGDIVSDLIDQADPPEVRYAKIIISSIRALKGVYKGLDRDNLKKQFDSINYRRLVPKLEYFSFLGVSLNEDFSQVLQSSYKDSVALFNSLKQIERLEQIVRSSEMKKDVLQDQLNSLNKGLGLIREILDQSRQYSDKIKQGVVKRNTFISQKINGSDPVSLSAATNLSKIQQEQALGFDIELSSVEIPDGSSPEQAQSIVNILSRSYDDIKAGSGNLDEDIKKLEKKAEEIQDQINSLQTEQVNSKSLENNAFKVYNLIRRAHVILGFKDVINVGDLNAIKNN